MAVDRLSMQFYSSLHPRGPHVQGIQFYLGNPGYEYLEEEKTGYAIRLPANQVVQEQIQPLLEPPTEWPSREPMVSYHDFAYQAQSWRLPRRVVAKVEWHRGELFPRVGFIVTNLSYPPNSDTSCRDASPEPGSVSTISDWPGPGRTAPPRSFPWGPPGPAPAAVPLSGPSKPRAFQALRPISVHTYPCQPHGGEFVWSNIASAPR